MQEFLVTNKVNCGFMSLTGYRTLIILKSLLESPKTNDEINECLLNDQYIKEKFSADTLRLYINSLRSIGCEITQANKSNEKKYVLISHPFTYSPPKSQILAINKLLKSNYEQKDIREILLTEKVLVKIANNIGSESYKNLIQKAFITKKIEKGLIQELIMHCEDKNQIIFAYNSPKSGEKNIELIADKLSFISGKLYLWGSNLTHNEYSYFPVSKIKKICGIKLSKSEKTYPNLKIIYEIDSKNIDLESDEKVIAQNEDKVTIEINAKNEFEIMQRILFLGDKCKVLEPRNFKSKLISKLKNMEKIYAEI